MRHFMANFKHNISFFGGASTSIVANPLIFYAFNSFQSLKHNNEAAEAPKMLQHVFPFLSA